MFFTALGFTAQKPKTIIFVANYKYLLVLTHDFFCSAKINDTIFAHEEEDEIAFDDIFDDHGEEADVDAVSTIIV